VPEHNPFVDEVLDRLQPVFPVNSRKMFGGHGIFHDGLMFALIADNELYLKACPETQAFFTDLNLEPFTYYKKDKPYRMAYYLVPESFFEDEDTTGLWARRAFEAALIAKHKK